MAQQIIYPKCQKGGEHIGELLNLVCLQRNCSHQSIICDVCYAQAHQGHKIKPLKVLLNNAKKYFKSKQLPNITHLKEALLQQEKALMLLLNRFEQIIQERLKDIYNSAKNVYPMLAQQLQKQSGFQIKQHIETLELLKSQELPYDVFNSFMQTLLAELPSENPSINDKRTNVSVAELERDLRVFSQKLEKQFLQQSKTVDGQLIKISKYFEQLRTKTEMLGSSPKFQFDPDLKHSQIVIPSPQSVRSVGGDGYRFALISPAVEIVSNGYKGEFFIKTKVSQWLAVGVCYKDRVVKSNFRFDFLTPNHGGYLLSSNGGGWSEIDSKINGTFWGFNIAQKDHIVVHYNPIQKQINFTNLRSQEQRSLTYCVRPEDKLHFCALFYYKNDEIEFLGEYKA